MDVFPVRLQVVEPSSLLIEWSDGRKQQYPCAELRSHCPCATCREQQRAPAQDPAASPAPTEPMRIVSMKPVGNYAYCIAFSDGHDTGIYTLEQLRELGREVPGG
jgi:DUF971 family protein